MTVNANFKKGMRYTQDIKAKVLADLTLGIDTQQTIADRHGLSVQTVRVWQNQSGLKQSPLHSPTDIMLPSRIDIGVLVFEYIEAGLKALKAQAELASDKAWLEKQPADGLYLFHGVLADKLIRLLAAIQPTANNNDQLTGNSFSSGSSSEGQS